MKRIAIKSGDGPIDVGDIVRYKSADRHLRGILFVVIEAHQKWLDVEQLLLAEQTVTQTRDMLRKTVMRADVEAMRRVLP